MNTTDFLNRTNAKPIPPRVCHKAAFMNGDGDVSALCSKSPRAIDMKRATWTTGWEAVTCKKCLKLRPEKEKRHE